MGYLSMQKRWCVLVCVLCFSFIHDAKGSYNVEEGIVYVNGTRSVARTDENFICATLDWWPPEYCNGTCNWGRSSILNLDLDNTLLFNAIKAFSPLKIRIGGSLQDRVIYQTEDIYNPQPCLPFAVNTSQLFNFTEGCLPLARWDELNSFLNRSGALFTFGLNALSGKRIRNGTAMGPWNPTNAASFIRYTVRKGYNVYGWEFGNELGGRAIGVAESVNRYASDTIALHELIHDIYKGVKIKPLIVSPASLFEQNWFRRYIAETSGSVDVVTQHIYNLGIGSVAKLTSDILNATVLDGGRDVLKSLHDLIKNSTARPAAWVGESGGVPNNGLDKVTNTYLFSFWYLDQLGMASIYDTKTFCRQTLVGGYYGLLNTSTFVPTPGYYSALLWHRLMGSRVLSTKFNGTKMIRAYAHCAKQSQGITVLLMNLDGNTTVHAKLDFPPSSIAAREVYHLAPMDGNIHSQTVLLNRKPLAPDSSGAIPAMQPSMVNSLEPITVAPHSIVFVHMPNVAVPACE